MTRHQFNLTKDLNLNQMGIGEKGGITYNGFLRPIEDMSAGA